MMPQFAFCTIDDLLVSPPTIALITALKLDGALQHLRVYGNQRGQRVRERTTHSRDNATLVTIKLEDNTHAVTATTLLVEDSWAPFTNGSMSGGIAAGSSDAQIALAEIEARLRNDPTLLDVYRQSVPPATTISRPGAALPPTPRPIISPAPQPSVAPISGPMRLEPTRATTRIDLPPPTRPAAPPTPTPELVAASKSSEDRPRNDHELPVTSEIVEKPEPPKAAPEPPADRVHNCDTDGIPAVIFEEHRPAAPE